MNIVYELPSGTVTFLFAGIERSANLWEVDPEPLRLALAEYDDLLRAGNEATGGKVVETWDGDYFGQRLNRVARFLVIDTEGRLARSFRPKKVANLRCGYAQRRLS